VEVDRPSRVELCHQACILRKLRLFHSSVLGGVHPTADGRAVPLPLESIVVRPDPQSGHRTVHSLGDGVVATQVLEREIQQGHDQIIHPKVVQCRTRTQRLHRTKRTRNQI